METLCNLIYRSVKRWGELKLKKLEVDKKYKTEGPCSAMEIGT